MQAKMQKIQVNIRSRPILPHEQMKGLKNTKVEIANDNTVVVSSRNGDKSFQFDKVLNQNYNNLTIYNAINIDELILKTLHGFNATIMAYGQTGSGKTYTFEGSRQSDLKTDAKGISQLAISQLFVLLKSFSNR